jgi:phosphoglycolate phosphatase
VHHVWSGVSAVVFDVDGTLLDSADGIVAGFAHALRSVGVEPPDDTTLRSDLGPPLDVQLTSLGLAPPLVTEAVLAYRAFYLREGRFLAAPYSGIREVLATLGARLPLGTATAKRTDAALATLQAHDLDAAFAVVNGIDDNRTTKAETIAHTLDLLGGPDPGRVVMVGDRHSDITGAQACGVRTAGVLWGYGSRSELEGAGADVLLEHPRQLVDLIAA